MTEANNEFEKLLQESFDKTPDLEIGDVIQGEVLANDEGKQFVIGIDDTGIEGVLPINEIDPDASDVADLANIGDKMELVVVARIGDDKENGSYLLSKRRLKERQVWEDLKVVQAEDGVVEAKVSKAVKGGLLVNVGVRGFIPASMISDHFVDSLKDYIGQTLGVKIIEIDPSKNRLILSHRAVLDEENKEKREQLYSTLTEGDIVTGKVARLTNFGAFVDLGGVDGLVHISQLSHQHISKPSDVVETGDEVKVKVLGIDKDKNRISLSIKETQPGPWDDIDENLAVGDVVEGVVKNLSDFGAFVEVLPGIQGLVHISQISKDHIEKPSDVLKPHDKVTVKVLSIEPDSRRLSISMIQANEDNGSESTEEVENTEE